jgi:hypothetical protein
MVVLSMWFLRQSYIAYWKPISDIELENYSIDSSPQLPKNLKFTAKNKVNPGVKSNLDKQS